MKFENVNDSSDVKISGDIQSNSVSIDTNNIDFLITILSTSLYSNPIPSFIRETVSNAWDSHVEAGVTEPVILELGVDTEGTYFCRIQDFGVGLSEDRFNKIYKNIGSSTKRGTNDQIGGFGIGRFSALAYSDIVYITSNYEGYKYKYVMYKDGNKLSIDLLHKQETTERNGVEVLVNLKSDTDLRLFTEAIQSQLVYFENLYVVDSTNNYEVAKFVHEFNNFHIKKYDNFLVNDLDYGFIDLILGKVRYPIRLSSLNKNYPDYINKYPITLVFQIGDLEVTPNREEILYNSKNISKIEEVLDRAIDEIKDIIDKYTHKDFTNINDYVKALEDAHHVYLMSEEDGGDDVKLSVPKKLFNISFKGVHYDKETFLEVYKWTMQEKLVHVNYGLVNGKLKTVDYRTNVNTIKTNFKKVYLCDVSSLNNMSKVYIREEMEDGAIFINPDKKDLKYYYSIYLKSLKKSVRNNYNYSNRNLQYDYQIVKVIFKSIASNIVKIPKFNNNSVPSVFIQKKKDEAKALRALKGKSGINWKENVNLKKFQRGTIADVITESETLSLEKVKSKYKKLTIFDEVGSEKLKTLAEIFIYWNRRSDVDIVEIAPTRMKMLDNFPNFKNIKNFNNMIEYKILRQIGTAKLIMEELPFIKQLASVKNINLISERLHNTIQELSDYVKKNLDNYNQYNDKQKALVDEIYQMCLDKNYFDEVVKATLNNNLESIKNARCILLFIDEDKSYKNNGNIPDSRINLVIDYVLARKLFRPDVKAVLKMKQETVLKPLI